MLLQVHAMSEKNKSVSQEFNIGILSNQFLFKNLTAGTLNKGKVICSQGNVELSFHWSTTSLKYHLRAKHVFTNFKSKVNASGTASRQTKLAGCSEQKVNKVTIKSLTNAVAKLRL